MQIDWRFNPPYSAHFGEIWEGFEEMSIILSQIEARLNSRPLCTLSEDLHKLEVLTPGHFLTGSYMLQLPETNYLDSNIQILSRWQYCSKLFQEFWKKWHHDYLHRLQQRTKWFYEEENLQVGQIVIIKEDQLMKPNRKKRNKNIINRLDAHPEDRLE